jgi:hypothetical protein
MSDTKYEAMSENDSSSLRDFLNGFLYKPGRNVWKSTIRKWEKGFGLVHRDVVEAFGAWRTIKGQLPTIHQTGFRTWFANIKFEKPIDVQNLMESHGHLHHAVHLCWKRWLVMLVDPCELSFSVC